MPRSLPRVIRVLIHYYAEEDHEPQHVYLGEAARCAPTCRPRSRRAQAHAARRAAAVGRGTIGAMAIEFSERIRRIPVYPAAGGYAEQAPLVRLASNESPLSAAAGGARGDRARAGHAQPLPRPVQLAAARAPEPIATTCPRSRIAIGNGSCDILLAAGEALLEPGAELVYAWPSFSVYPHLAAASGARAVTVALDADERHDLTAMLREITVATRLVIVCNPNNPTSTALPLRGDRRVRRRGPAARVRDRRRGLLRVQPARGPRRLDRAARARTPTSCCCGPSRRCYGLCGLRVGFALCGSERAAAGARPGAPAVLLQRPRPGRRGRGAGPPGRGHRARHAHRRRAHLRRRAPARARAAGRRVAGELLLVRPRRDATRSEVMRGLQERGVLVRGGAALGSADARAARHLRDCRRRTHASSTRSPRCSDRDAPCSQRLDRQTATVSCLTNALTDDHDRDGSHIRSAPAPRRMVLSYAYAWRFS